MANKYFIWKDRNCNGHNPEWVEMKGKEFFDFLNSADGKGRRFILLGNNVCAEADVISLRRRRNSTPTGIRSIAVTSTSKGCAEFQHVSLDALCADGESDSFHALMADADAAFEEDVIRSNLRSLLPHALSTLSEPSREAILLKYFEYPALSDAEIAERIGVEPMTFSKRRKRALAALKILKTDVQNPKLLPNV